MGWFSRVKRLSAVVPEVTERMHTAGWELRRGVAYSPQIRVITQLDRQVAGYDPGNDVECYVFDAPKNLGERSNGGFTLFEKNPPPATGRVDVFVTWPAFALNDSNDVPRLLSDRFWKQLESLQPQAYIGDGWHHLTFVSLGRNLFDLVHRRLCRNVQRT